MAMIGIQSNRAELGEEAQEAQEAARESEEKKKAFAAEMNNQGDCNIS